MSKRILLFQIFWTDGHVPCTRTQNIKYTKTRNLELVNYLKSEGIDIDYKLYDYSPQRCIEDSFHIPYPKGIYKRAEKINNIVQNNKDYDYMFSIDADAFFHEQDFEKIKHRLDNIPDNVIALYDMAKLTPDTSGRVIEGDVFNLFDEDYYYIFSGQLKQGKPLEGSTGGLGGCCLFDAELFRGVGGFDEKYVSWGGEDVELLDRIQKTYQDQLQLIMTSDCYAFHLHHFRDLDSEAYIQQWIRKDWFDKYPEKY